MKCFNCGFDNLSTEEICTNCGAYLRGIAPAISNNLLLQSRYQILKTLGQGGMGNVYQAKDTTTGQIVAIKEMLNYFRTAEERAEAVQRFNQEADILASIDHPNILKVFSKFAENNRHYLVMEYLEGKDLNEILERTGTPLPEDEVLRIAKKICEVLDYLHNYTPQIIYRDLKPANIIRTETGEIKLIDFGIARFFNPIVNVTSIGTPAYAPREQVLGRAEPRSDIYALGATLHHLLTNQEPIPFTFPPIENVKPNFAKVIEKALADNMEKRYSSTKEMLADLEHLSEPDFRVQGYTPQFVPHTVKRSVLAVDIKSIDYGTIQQKRGTIAKNFHITNPAYSARNRISPVNVKSTDYKTVLQSQATVTSSTPVTPTDSIREDLLKGIIETNRDWIKVDPTYFAIEEAGSVSVTVDVSQLTSGQYSGAVIVTSNGGIETIVILVTVEAPTLKVNPQYFSIGDIVPGQKKELSLFLVNSNPKSGYLEGTITLDQLWISMSMKKFRFQDEQLLHFQINSANLEHGSNYNAIITVDSNGGNKDIPVSLHVLAPVLDIVESKLEYGEFIRKQRKVLSFVIKNTGDGILQGNIRTSHPWLKVYRTEFQVSNTQTIQCMVDTAFFKKSSETQKCKGQIFINSNNGSKGIDVTLIIRSENFFQTMGYSFIAWWRNRNVTFRG